MNNQEYFFIICATDNLKNAQIIYNKYKNEINIHDGNEYIFRYACCFGKLKLAKWLYTLDNNFNIHANDEYALKYACINGNLKLVKWLYSLDNKFNIHINNNEIFKETCCRGKLKIAQWLYSLDDKLKQSLYIYINNNNEFFDMVSSYSGNMKLLKWLYNIKIDVDNAKNIID